MSDLTKEYFAQQLKGLEGRSRAHTEKEITGLKAYTEKEITGLKAHTDEEITGLKAHTEKEITGLKAHTEKEITGLKAHTEKEITASEERLKAHTEHEVSNLARMVSNRFDNIERVLDVREKVEKLEHQMREVRQAIGYSK